MQKAMLGPAPPPPCRQAGLPRRGGRPQVSLPVTRTILPAEVPAGTGFVKNDGEFCCNPVVSLVKDRVRAKGAAVRLSGPALWQVNKFVAAPTRGASRGRARGARVEVD